MSDSEHRLVRGGPEPSATSSRRSLIGGIVALVILAMVAGGAWWFFLGRETVPDWGERSQEIALAAPAGDAFLDDTPWVTLQAAPLQSGEASTFLLGLRTREGESLASDTNPSISGLTVQPVGGAGDPVPLELAATGDASGTVTATTELSQPGWWQFDIGLDGAEEGARFYLLVPDPNINGPGAVPRPETTAEGEALFERGMNALTSLQSVRYMQWLSDGRGNAGISDHAVTAGNNGALPGFTYRAPGGMEAIVIGSTRWVRLPNDFGWTTQEGAASVPPSEWGEEYEGATGFTILGEETIDGAQTQILSLVVPEIVEPRRQTAAWYLWWIDTETGNIVQEAMISRVHYMLNEFSDFDAPLQLEPPDLEATPGAATPVP